MSKHFRYSLFIAATLTLAAASPAAAQSAAEATCRTTIATEVAAYVKKSLTTIQRCHLKRSKGKIALATDCNDVAQADSTGSLASARDRLRSRIGEACNGAGGLLAQYGRCPSPAQTVDDAGTAGIDGFDEVAECMIALVDSYAGQAGEEAMGLPRAVLRRSAARCQKQTGKDLAKLLARIAKERVACQAELDALASGLEYGCNDTDPDGAIGGARAKLELGIAKRCEIDDDPELTLKQELNVIGACADTPADLADCIGDAVGLQLGAGLVAMAYSLPETCTAGGIIRTIRAGNGDQFSATVLNLGWTGTAHLVDGIDRPLDTIILGSCDADCASCNVDLDPRKAFPDAICRCGLNPTTKCDTINGLDIDDCGLLDTCYCNLGTPLALSGGGVPVCAVNRYAVDHGGTVDIGTGEWQSTDVDTALVHVGENTQVEPCPTCQGDVTQNDGNRDGTCTRGLRVGLPCDVNSVHPDFGPASNDCPPNPGTNVSGTGVELHLDFATTGESLAATLPCDAPPGALCPCRVCSGNTLLGCSSDAECTAAGAGTCTSSGIGEARPNQCADSICTNGVCEAGPTEMFCDGVVRGNGRGFLQCNTIADCAALGAGGCTISQKRPCYDDPITIEARGNHFGADLSSIFCIAATNSAAVNNAGGLPGAGAVTLNGDYTTTCASDPSVVWQPPTGVNCP